MIPFLDSISFTLILTTFIFPQSQLSNLFPAAYPHKQLTSIRSQLLTQPRLSITTPLNFFRSNTRLSGDRRFKATILPMHLKFIHHYSHPPSLAHFVLCPLEQPGRHRTVDYTMQPDLSRAIYRGGSICSLFTFVHQSGTFRVHQLDWKQFHYRSIG